MIFPRDHLVAALHQRGICYLAPSPHGDEPELTDDALLIGLATSKDGRLRFALAGLLLVHPDLADDLAAIVEAHPLSPEPGDPEPPQPQSNEASRPTAVVDELKKQYLAAMYLQRMWRTRLQQHFGDSPLIEERFTAEWNLPAADAMYGELGLRRLTDRSTFNDWSSYEQVLDMICDQPCVALPLPPGKGWGEG